MSLSEPLHGARWFEVERLVDGALDRPAAEREAYLGDASGGDEALLQAAARLLEACTRAEQSKGCLSAPAAVFAAPLMAAPAEADRTTLMDTLRQAVAGRYAVEREIGRGGMATVFLARDLRHEREVAVKVVERGVAAGAAERFLQEIRTAARLTHPHVLSVHDSGEADGLLFYVMPYVEGETLRRRLGREGGLPVGDAVRLLRELASALAYAHSRGVVHCDLKPENILLSDGHAVVADFGIARALAAAGAEPAPSAAVLGTPAYMAPEQVRGERAPDPRADLYSLGIVAFEVLSGSHPFGRRAPAAYAVAHRDESPPALRERRPDVPAPLAELITRLLAKSPGERPESAAVVLRALDSVTEAPRLQRRWKALALAVAAVLAAAGYLAGRPVPSGAPAPEPGAIRGVAVLPFAGGGGSPEDGYFTDGIRDELAHALGRLPGVRVAGRTSSYAFRGTEASAARVGRELGVDALITGTVRHAGDRLRLSAELVGTADGKVIWDSVFESQASDLFAVQDEFTRAILDAVAPALRGSRPRHSLRGTTDEEAYDLYLRGRFHWLERGRENVELAISYLERAVSRDPRFARAHAGLAMAYGTLPSYVPLPGDSITRLVRAGAERALALDSTVADGHVALGMALDRELRFEEAEASYRAAIALEPPHVMAHHGLGFVLMSRGRVDQAVAVSRRAAQLDPLARSAVSAWGLSLVHARRFEEARRVLHPVVAADSLFPIAQTTLAAAELFGGRPDSAVVRLERMLHHHPDGPGMRSLLVLAYAVDGRWGDAERTRRVLRAAGGDASGGVERALAELVFGDPEPLVRVLATRDGRSRWLDAHGAFGCNPLLDPLWSDPRFRAEMQRLRVEACRLVRPWPIGSEPGGVPAGGRP